MTFKQLEAIYWSAILGSFALAAERLNMTQSALSKRIIELELELGLQLFDRSGPRAKTTEHGEALLEKAEKLLSLRDEIIVDSTGPKSIRGVCRFGISELMAMKFLPRIVAETRERFPEVILEPRVAVTRELLSDVERGETEFAIAPGRSERLEIDHAPICSVRLVWVAAPSLIEQDGPIDEPTLLSHPIVSMSAQAGSTIQLQEFATREDLRLRRLVASNSPEAVAAITIAGLGVALLAEPFAEKFIAAGQLRKLDVIDRLEVPELEYSIHWRASNGRMLSKKIRELSLRVCLGCQ